MSKVIKIDLLKKYTFELGGKEYKVTEPTFDQSIKYDKAVKAFEEDGEKIYEETRKFLHILGIPKTLGIGLSGLQEILSHITPQKKN